ncbi:MAG: PleD family two-component system response regulator [Opitutales bacterium]
MRLKILTTDDSKAVRIIIKKCFTSYDVDIFEASNGVEGLAVASKETPDIILLDVTMPVMDGVEMLTKLKSDPLLKGIPVIMLTAEAGRENVLKIAKIGIRDYIVKPFKEDVLIEKVGRVVDLRPVGEQNTKRKGLNDSCKIVVVEDKATIVDQIKEGLKDTPWEIQGTTSTGETIDLCQKDLPDLILISLSLPDDGAATLFRLLRSNMKTKYVPVFGLAVKTAMDEQQQAQQMGFNAVITKPIDFPDMESKIAKAINLDTSERYFNFEEDFLLIRLPERCNSTTVNEISNYIKPKVSEAVDSGYYKVIFDVSKVRNVDMNVIKLLINAMQACRDLTLSHSLVGSTEFASEAKGFEECKDWVIHNSVEDAKSAAVS